MKYLYYAILVISIGLSLAAGSAKIGSAEQEVQFFAAAGLQAELLLPFGIVQITGALAAIYHKSRAVGLVLMGLSFFASSAVIFMTGNVQFGAVSLIPAIAVFILYGRLPLQ